MAVDGSPPDLQNGPGGETVDRSLFEFSGNHQSAAYLAGGRGHPADYGGSVFSLPNPAATGHLGIFTGVLLATAVFFVANFLDLKGIEWIYTNLSHVALIALIVIFQPELRKIFERAASATRQDTQHKEDGLFTRFWVRLPVSESQWLPEAYGTRHHAAMGLAERTDALTIVVSEERGQVSVFRDGQITPVSEPAESLEK